MSSKSPLQRESRSSDGAALVDLCRQVWAGRNGRDTDAFAAPFAEDAEVIGFDGNLVLGRAELGAHLRQIFAEHQTPAYVGKVKSVRLLAADVALVRALVGMVPPGRSDLEARLNAMQVFVAARREGEWRFVSLQNTPAQFHGRPDLVEQLTEELRQLL